jgi:hypothetical protein
MFAYEESKSPGCERQAVLKDRKGASPKRQELGGAVGDGAGAGIKASMRGLAFVAYPLRLAGESRMGRAVL